MKRLLGTPAYFLLLCGTILKFSSLIGLFTFKAKYMEQQFGQSASRANFLLGKNTSTQRIYLVEPNNLSEFIVDLVKMLQYNTLSVTNEKLATTDDI